MADGGRFPWKLQKIDSHRGPVTNYKGLAKPLPNPPRNMHWIYDDKTREWRLEKQADSEMLVVDGEVVQDDEQGDDDIKEGIEKNDAFLLHEIQNTDTFQGICLRYKLTPTELRRANRFSGSNLQLAPNPLKIPKREGQIPSATLIQGPPLTREETILQLLNVFPGLARSEAKCYLELNDWNVDQAILDAKDHEGVNFVPSPFAQNNLKSMEIDDNAGVQDNTQEHDEEPMRVSASSLFLADGQRVSGGPAGVVDALTVDNDSEQVNQVQIASIVSIGDEKTLSA
jgi:hypothetical protein